MSQGATSSVQSSTDEEPSTESVKMEATEDVQRVLKEVGLTSATFIGPTFPPEKKLDDSLNDFYKELRDLDNRAPKERDQPQTSVSDLLENPSREANVEKSPTEGRSRPPEKHPPRPRWYGNKPYSTQRPDTPPSRNHRYPPPAFRPPPDPGWRNRFWQPRSYPNLRHLPPPGHTNAIRFPPLPSAPHYYHPNWEDLGARWCREAPQDRHFNDGSSPYVLVLMRGLPGSGKTTMARSLLAGGPGGLILSTDDYFAHRDGYRYEPSLLGEAHEWNHKRAREAMRAGRSPVIIDNTNLQAWEMKPYVQMALQKGYRVDFCEPNTSWKYDPLELEK
ncbi:NEDD4-binding protein 2-like 2 isoform X2 [Corythoichthys intestinalis]|uniref:NEDD4-binding protein 2-like 2 isoform X2 n=1 Tax=Corythoichthys intestinalis TaxID=161448 RepID=UPI0025A5F6E8|nr:NEDD4-binding protein 2-like 2 isoform X2 [Corythoichthys intestinalis]